MNPFRFIPLIIISALLSGCNVNFTKPITQDYIEQKSKSSEPISSKDFQKLGIISESIILNPSQNQGIKLDDPEKLNHDDAISDLAQTIDQKKFQGTKAQPFFNRALDYCEASKNFSQKGDPDNALNALDQAYAMIIDIDTSDNPKIIQQKEDVRILISKRILEIYASRNVVVTRNHKTIPMTLNKYVQSEIDRLTKGPDRDFFIESYRRSGQFRPYIIEKLKMAGLPENLSWLPLIESGFQTQAFSKSQALGLWQFIPTTGSKFGLKMNIYIDERLDPDKSTMAAIEYLKKLHQIFGDWTTVLAAYNYGEGRVLRIIRNQNINYLDNFWDLYERLPWETSRFVPKFLATIHIVNNMRKYGFQNIKPYPPYKYESVEITKQAHLESIAKCIGKPFKELTRINPELRYKMLPPETYLLKIPSGTKKILLSLIDKIPVASLPQHSFACHRVQKDQTLSTIAKHYGTTSKKIQSYNRLKGTDLKVGQVLKLPGKSTTPTSIKKYKKYFAKAGDSPYNIAARHNMPLQQFMMINDLTSKSMIRPGQRLYVE
jgi:membrane-bound lytic murein transglycosylase D